MLKSSIVAITLSAILLTIIYIASIVALGNNIESELIINSTRYEDYLLEVKYCDKINGTILSIFGYECSKTGCGECRDRCMSPKEIYLPQYRCFLLNVYNSNMVSKITTDACLSYVNPSKISMHKSKWTSDIYFYVVVFSTAALIIAIMLIGLCIYLHERR